MRLSAQQLVLPVEQKNGIAEPEQLLNAANAERALLDTFLSRAPVGFTFLDRDLRYIRINDALAEINGIPAQAHLNRTIEEIVPTIAPTVRPQFEAVLHTGEPLLNIEVSGETAQQPGVTRHWLENVYPVQDANGQIIGLGVIVVEITERKRRERNLALLAELPDLFAHTQDPQAVMRTVGARLAAHLGLLHCLFVSIDAFAQIADVVYDEHGITVQSLTGAYELAHFHTPEERQNLAQGKVIVIDDVYAAPRSVSSADEFAALGIHALITAPYVSDGRWTFALCVQRAQPYMWQPDEIELVRELAAQIYPRLERLHAERRLHESRVFFDRVTDLAPTTLYIYDVQAHRNVWINQDVYEALGYTADEIQALGTAVMGSLMHPEDLVRFAAHDQHLRRLQPNETASFEYRMRHKHGGWRWMTSREMAFTYAPDGSVVQILGAATDITERKATEQALAERERALDLLLKIADTAQEDTTEQAIAATACRLVRDELGALRCTFGLIDTAANQLTVVAVASAEDAPQIAQSWALSRLGVDLINVLQQGNPLIIEDTATHPMTVAQYATVFGPMHTRALVNVPIMHDAQLVAYLAVHVQEPQAFSTSIVTLLRNVATRLWEAVQRRRAEAALRASEARLLVLYEQEQAARAQAEAAGRLKDEFLATVSHELRTPLTSILGYSQLLQKRQHDAAYVSRTIDRIVQGAKTQAQLIEDLLDVARVANGKLRLELLPIDLHSVVRAAIDTLRPTIEAKSLELRVELDPSASNVIGDSHRLQQVIWNLISNAVKFTPTGGQIALRLCASAQEARLVVSDSGQGISAEFLPYVFDRFRQAEGDSARSHSGLGLGLAIVRHIVELHGGTVSVASAGIGQGATFEVCLPLQQSASDQPATIAAAEDLRSGCPPELAGLRILVVDDQQDILNLLEEMLTPCGALVHAVANAPDALEAIQTQRPDLLISDIAMPGADGYWLIEHIRALPATHGGDTPAIALTAYVRIEERVRILGSGFQRYVPKPIDPAELRVVVAGLVREGRGER